MKLKKWSKGKKLLQKSDRFELYETVKVWKYHKESHESFVITLIVDNEDELKETWKLLRNDAAFFMQPKIKPRDNRRFMYILFFVKQSVSIETKIAIGINLFSMRTMVFDCFDSKALNVSEYIEALAKVER